MNINNFKSITSYNDDFNFKIKKPWDLKILYVRPMTLTAL